MKTGIIGSTEREMTAKETYTMGFEDGFAAGVFNTNDMTPQQAFSYRKGFAAGENAQEEFSFWKLQNE
jgi:hypothetical protein